MMKVRQVRVKTLWWFVPLVLFATTCLYYFSRSEFPVEYKSLEVEAEYWRSHETGNLPDQTILKTLSAKDVHLYFHSYLDNLGTLCHRTIRLGTIFNGGYRVCDDEQYRPRVPCMVYSFGMKTDCEWENEAAQLYGCQVHYFDPSLQEKPRNLSERVAWYRVGLGGRKGELEAWAAADRDAQGWTTRSLSDIKTLTGHTGVILDVVKLDIEGWEWTALADMATSGELDKVRQLVVELHNVGGTDAEVTRQRLSVLRSLENAGFQIFSTNLDEWSGERQKGVYPVERTSIYEVSFVNTKLARTDLTPQLDSNKPQAQVEGKPLPGVVDMEFLRTNGNERGGLPDDDQLFERMIDKQVHYAYHSYLDNVHYHCKRTIKLGNLIDGGYKVCDDRQFRPRRPCLVYSFGIRNDFSFDDAVASVYGCNVSSFDPSMDANNHRHSSMVTYYKLGLGGKGGQLEEKGEQLKAENHWTVKSMSDIKKMLGHQDRILDVVKIDIETSEWPALADMAASGELSTVRQLLMEFHIYGGSDAGLMRRRVSVIRLLEKAGFRTFYTWQYAGWPEIERMRGVYPVIRTICYETSFVNINLARP
ncbi:uncharacterized protein [Littorina saxatilis]|uniref:uncharacterized protein isoform X2 n=1 Tax=Littorina saxatilis TaxID=31220 RepID=UPI0038B6979A